MLVTNKLLTYAALAIAVAIGGGLADQSAGQPAATPQIGAWGFDITGIDPKAKPGDSFFDYANGAWDARTVIPPDVAASLMIVCTCSVTRSRSRCRRSSMRRRHPALQRQP